LAETVYRCFSLGGETHTESDETNRNTLNNTLNLTEFEMFVDTIMGSYIMVKIEYPFRAVWNLSIDLVTLHNITEKYQ
jgi:hypothetical protein